MLKNKSNAICYHAVYKTVTMGEALVADIPMKRDLAYLFTKVLYSKTWQFLANQMLWDVLHRM